MERWAKSVPLKRAHKKAFVEVNDKMCSNSVFDTMMSGTTGITACLDQENLLVANCGDSRCVVAVDLGDDKLTAQPLSKDQTPHRRDELRRVKRAGAMVCNMAQLEGAEPMHENWSLTLGDVIDDGGDPPRLFLRGKVYPGVAFTRSIGDALAQGIGVFAEPEMSELTLNSQHKFLILASDGIWEFITNQEAVDILEKNRESPLRACHALVCFSTFEREARESLFFFLPLSLFLSTYTHTHTQHRYKKRTNSGYSTKSELMTLL